MFVAGCGADANPIPRGTLELVEAHGTALADAVDRGLKSAGAHRCIARGPHTAPSICRSRRTTARERWRRQLEIDDIYMQRHAALMKASSLATAVCRRRSRIRCRCGGSVPRPAAPMYRFHPRRARRRGGGRLRAPPRPRVPGRSGCGSPATATMFSDTCPPLRVLREGGYEGGDAMIYYGRPGPFTEQVEELIVGEVRRLAGGRS